MAASSTRCTKKVKLNRNEPCWYRILAAQLRLRLERSPAFRREDFIVSDANVEAVRTLDAWPHWPGGALALTGPAGSGKTHLARAWAERSGAIAPGAEDAFDPSRFEGVPVLLEDVDQADHGETLFHLINIAVRGDVDEVEQCLPVIPLIYVLQ